MPNPEVLSWVLSGALFVITCIGGALYKMLREEAKEHSDRIEKKANSDRLTEIDKANSSRMTEIESRWQGDLIAVKANNKELITELRQRHERELDALGARVSEQIKSVEVNVIARIELMVAALRPNHTP